MVAEGYDCLSLNRRGHDVLTLTPGWKPAGDALATYSDHMKDVQASLDFLKGKGYKDTILIGHSLGGFLAAATATQDVSVKGIILASPIPRYITISGRLPKDAKADLIEKSKSILAKGKGEQLFVLPVWTWVISAKSALEDIDSKIPLLKELLQKTKIPLLCFAGTKGVEAIIKEPARQAIDASPSLKKKFTVLEGSNHFYQGYEDKVRQIIKSWLKSNFPPYSSK